MNSSNVQPKLFILNVVLLSWGFSVTAICHFSLFAHQEAKAFTHSIILILSHSCLLICILSFFPLGELRTFLCAIFIQRNTSLSFDRCVCASVMGKTFKINIQKIKMFILVITSVDMGVQSAKGKVWEEFSKIKTHPSSHQYILRQRQGERKRLQWKHECNVSANTFEYVP